jgi:hypothetical protein
MRLGKKNSTNLGQFDYLHDLNIMLFSNVVDQAAQKTEYYLAYYMGGGGDKKADIHMAFTFTWHYLSEVHRVLFSLQIPQIGPMGEGPPTFISIINGNCHLRWAVVFLQNGCA